MNTDTFDMYDSTKLSKIVEKKLNLQVYHYFGRFVSVIFLEH